MESLLLAMETKNIIIIAVLAVVFIFLFFTMIKVFGRVPKKDEVKPNEKPAEVDSTPVAPKEEVTDDIPQVLKDVTTQNYMQNISNSVDETNDELISNMPEMEKPSDDVSINLDAQYNPNAENPQPFKVENLAPMQDDDAQESTDDIIDDMDNPLENAPSMNTNVINDEGTSEPNQDNTESEQPNNNQSLSSEFRGLSKEMKIASITNLLNKHDGENNE